MSRIKDLKANPDSTFNIIDLLMTFIPVKKSKYAELVYNILKNNALLEKEGYMKLRSEMMSAYDIPIEYFEGMTPYQLVILSRLAGSFFSPSQWKLLGKFSELNERGVIEQSDVTKYKSLSEIKSSVESAQLKLDMKEMEKYVKKIYEGDGWMVIRPLTYQSALKYGYGTKWCTSSESTTSQFEDYSKRGILIYSINTKTGHKIACFKELRTNGEFSFWNQIDTRIDSMESNLPSQIIDAIRKEISDFPVSNAIMKRNMETNGVSPLPDTAKKMAELALKLAEQRRRTNTNPEQNPLRVEVESELSRFMNRNIEENVQEVNEPNLMEIPQRNFDNVNVSVDPVRMDDPFVTLFLRPELSGVAEIRGVTEIVPGRSVQLDSNGLPRSSDEYIGELNKFRTEE